MRKNILRLLLFISLVCAAVVSPAQYYWVYFTDKDGVAWDPSILQQRMQQPGVVVSESDYPVNQAYVEGVACFADSIGYVSRWFNAVAVKSSEVGIMQIKCLPYVAGCEASDNTVVGSYASDDYDLSLIDSQDQLMDRQVRVLGLDMWQAAGIDGAGLKIAVFDGGFPTWKDNPVFEHLRSQQRILYTWDFTKNKEDVDRGISHGTAVLSCIGGMINDRPVGLATGASYMLAITEVRSEPFKEEQNWLAAAEWAHKNGADIINSSLGYTNNRYFNDQMDGRTSFVTRAANMAASKGILVVNAAGNEGDGKWKIVGAPADADSVLSVGGLNPATDYHTSFSSFGPTFDKRMKPNVVAYGHVIAAGKKGLVSTQGTSFSSPLMAGFAACAWQTDRSLTNMELFRRIEQSGHLYPYYDYAHGFGVPRASQFLPEYMDGEDVSEEYNTDEWGFDEEMIADSIAAVREWMSEEVPAEAPAAEVWEEPVTEVPAAEVWEEPVDEEWEETPETVVYYDILSSRRPLSVFVSDDGRVEIELNIEERLNSGSLLKTDQYLYVHIQDAQGVLKRYFLFEVGGKDEELVLTSYELDIPLLEKNEMICVHFRGSTECATFFPEADQE